MGERIEWMAREQQRLDVLLAEAMEATRSRAAALIRDGRVTVEGVRREKAGFEVKAGWRIEAEIPDAAPARAVAQDLPVRILYQDGELAVVYKPSGMTVHPAPGNPDGTLVNALLARLDSLSGIGGEMRPGIVHRIDKDTSGILLVAKNDRAHAALSEQIALHTVDRAYITLVEGRLKEHAGVVDGPIARHPVDRKKMAIVPGGKSARTHWRILEEMSGSSLVECILETGRTHQIRVHMASLGHPVLGDPVYGRKNRWSIEGGQLLHAYRLGFTHPVTGERMVFEAPAEERFYEWYHKLGGTLKALPGETDGRTRE